MDLSETFLIHSNPSTEDQTLILYYFYIFRTFHSNSRLQWPQKHPQEKNDMKDNMMY